MLRNSKNSAQPFVKQRITSCPRYGVEDRISALPDDLLLTILVLVPTKDAVATMILSKRWQSIWTMVPRLGYTEIKDVTHKTNFIGGLLGCLFGKSKRPRSIWWFLNQSLRLHKAPRLGSLDIQLGPHCPIDADVGKWLAYAVDRRVRDLGFQLMWSAEPISLPKSLYTCDTLVSLRLSNKVFVDVSSPVCLPSLKILELLYVVYRDEDAVVRLLSSCPVLEYLYVVRHRRDNVKKFSVKVPSLVTLKYCNVEPKVVDIEGSFVVDTANLKELTILVISTNYSCSIENMLRLDKAVIYCYRYPDENFMKRLSSVRYLEILLGLEPVSSFQDIHFSQLIECKIRPCNLDWFEPLVSLLHNSPELKVLLIDQVFFVSDHFPLSFKQPDDVPLCLSTKLEIFEWKEYGGRSEEKQVLRYILANSKCLKRVGISLKSTWQWNKNKIMDELKSMSRISTSSQLLFSTQLEFEAIVED